MGLLKLTTENAPATPAAGTVTTYFDTTTLPLLRTVDQNGNNSQVAPIITASAASGGQSPAATTRTYVTGSKVQVPANKLKIGSVYRCRMALTKTAAGTASSTFDVAFGTAGTTADTARCSFTKPAGTAAGDEGWVEIEVTIQGPLSASGIAVGEFIMYHNGNTTGHMTIPVAVVLSTSGTFDVTVANLFIGVCITTGASDAITITQCQAELVNC